MFEGNPFPGLRPFEFDENYLFFGREEQVAQLLSRLGNTRFLAVVGASGSGKSSLVRAGLLPELHGGTMTGTSIAWELAIMRPGGDPLTNLAESLVATNLFGESNEENILHTRATLSRSGLGLIEAYRQSNIEKGSNLLLLVDQFEEIFRFRQSGAKASQEAAHFIQLLLETSRQSEMPLFIILTMRSDFLGDCAEFAGLAEAVNEGEYLIPRLNRKQRTRAIEGPVKVGGAEISPRLKQQLLNDIGDDPDQLPILQHALMRMWEHWQTHADADAPLDLEHYDAIGRMVEALSLHADEVYADLPDDTHRQLCMKLFKAITEKQADGRGIRRPLPFGDINEISGQQREQLMTVIDAYRPAGRTFIMPGEEVTIHDQTIIDISHESLMRVWNRLKGWVREEADSARIYFRLCETAQLHNRGEAGLYRDPDLKIALAWRDQHKPNAQWASRINDVFDLSMKFLDNSKEDFEAEQRAKEEARKRELEQAQALAEAEQKKAEVERKSAKRNKFFAAFLFALASLAVVLALQANRSKKKAMASEKQAVESEKLAQDNLSFAHHSRSDLMMQDDLSGQALARMGYRYREHPEYTVIPEKVANHLNHTPFIRQSRVVFQNPEDIMLRTRIAVRFSSDKKRLFFLHNEADKSYLKVVGFPEGKEISRSEFFKNVEAMKMSENGKFGFVMGSAINEPVSGGIVIDADSGATVEYFAGTTSQDRITAISGTSDLKRVLVGQQNGVLKIYDLTNEKEEILSANLEHKIHAISVSPDQSNAVALVLKDESYAKLFHIDLKRLERPVECFKARQDQVFGWSKLEYSPSGTYFSLFGGNFTYGHVSVHNSSDGSFMWMNDTSHFRFQVSADFSPDETILATPSIDATVRLWDVKTGKEISTPLEHDGGLWQAVFSPDQTKLAVVSDVNDIWVWSLSKGTVLNFPKRQKSEVVGLVFSEKGDKLFSVTIDGEMLEWTLNVPTFQPTLLTHDGEIWGYDLTENGKWAATGGNDDVVSLWDMENKMRHGQLSFTNDVGMVEFRKNDSRLFAVQIEGLTPVRWNAYTVPDLDYISQGDMPSEDTYSIAISPNGEFVAYSQKNYEVSVVRVKDGEKWTLPGHGGLAEGIQFSPDSKTIVTIGADNYIRVFETESGKGKYSRPYGGLFMSQCQFSKDGTFFVIHTQLGRDSTTPVAYETKSGKELFRLQHGNGVSEVFFSHDGKYIYTGSRDYTAKMWDLSDTSKPLRTFVVGDWVSSQITSPEHPNRLIISSRGGDIYIYDTETGLYVDGPYRGSSNVGYRRFKLKSKPEANYFLALNSPHSVAAWPYAPPKMKVNNPDSLMSFAAAINGLDTDKNEVLSVIKDAPAELKKRANVLQGDKMLNRWKHWHLTGNEDSNPYNSMKSIDNRKFLISQNTLTSLQEVLYQYPMDKEVIKLHADKLEYLSGQEDIEEATRQRYGKSANWYRTLVE